MSVQGRVCFSLFGETSSLGDRNREYTYFLVIAGCLIGIKYSPKYSVIGRLYGYTMNTSLFPRFLLVLSLFPDAPKVGFEIRRPKAPPKRCGS